MCEWLHKDEYLESQFTWTMSNKKYITALLEAWSVMTIEKADDFIPCLCLR